MEQTAIQSGSPGFAEPAPRTGDASMPEVDLRKPHLSQRWKKSYFFRGLTVIASLKLTVVLFALSLFLVFWGTLAQVDLGNFTVVQKYFRTLYVWVPLRYVVFLPYLKQEALPFYLPYPGGWLLGGLMMTNLLSAHIVRFKMHWTQIGIWLIHFGIALMMMGEFFTGLYAVEGYMSIPEGQAANFVEHNHVCELAIVQTVSTKQDRVFVVPGNLLRQLDKISDPDNKLPFEVAVKAYYSNADTRSLEDGEEGEADAGLAAGFKLVPMKEEAGVASEQKVDAPGAYITLRKDGKNLGTYLFSVLNIPDWIRVGDQTYQIGLRFKRTYRDFNIHLDKFTHATYGNSSMAKDYRAEVSLQDKALVNGKPRNDNRRLPIYMNHPLVYHGETFYQADLLKDRQKRTIGTILQVVRNPAWSFPYWSCLIVTIGMLFHFLLTMTRFFQRGVSHAKA